MTKKKENRCGWQDCFTCPYTDCIAGTTITRSKRSVESSREYHQKITAYRKENRLCTRCGKPLGDTPYQTCEFCRQHTAAARKRSWINTGKLKRAKEAAEGKTPPGNN